MANDNTTEETREVTANPTITALPPEILQQIFQVLYNDTVSSADYCYSRMEGKDCMRTIRCVSMKWALASFAVIWHNDLKHFDRSRERMQLSWITGARRAIWRWNQCGPEDL